MKAKRCKQKNLVNGKRCVRPVTKDFQGKKVCTIHYGFLARRQGGG